MSDLNKTSEPQKSVTSTEFLPNEKRQGATKLLPWVMAVMVYLSALALMGVMLLDTGFDRWGKDLQNHITVQITEDDAAKSRQTYEKLAIVLSKTVGVKSFYKLDDGEIKELLEPWLGAGNVTMDLPIPLMIDVTLEEEITLNINALRKKLQEISPKINLDDHQQWLAHFNDLTTMVRSIAFGILFLVVMAAVSIVIFGTKAGMAEHKNTIEVVHMLGASDSMIAKSFQKRFFYYGFRGGVIGFLGALVTIFLLYNIMSNLGENLIADVELPVTEILFLFLLPVLSAFLSMFTARITVLRALKLMV